MLLNITLFESGTAPFTTFTVPASATLSVQALSLYTLYVTVPAASAVAPLSVAGSCTTVAPSFPAELDSAVVMLGLAHMGAWSGTGAMKSFNSVSVDEPEERAWP